MIDTAASRCCLVRACLFLLVFTSPLVAQQPFLLRDATEQSGIGFVHTDGSTGKRYVVESFSGGVSLMDFDCDGDLDVYFLNGSKLPPDPAAADAPQNALYRNDGQFRFSDVTGASGLGDRGFGLGVAAADFNGDGFSDIYISNFGSNALYRNNGDGTYSNVTDEARVDVPEHIGAGVCFVDVDNDGHVDLYVANYLEFSLDQHRPHVHKGAPAYASPLSFRPALDVLFKNNGDGTFTDVSESSGIAKLRGYGMGVVASDYDQDGDQDIFVANDVQANFLLQNDGGGHFVDVAPLAGTAYDLAGKPQASMGVDAADFNNDGLIDFQVTNYSNEFSTLYRNLGEGLFEDATRVTSAGEGSFPHVTWGNGFADFDNDGLKDLFIACGHLDDNIHLRGGSDTTAFAVPNVVLRNMGKSGFRDVSAQAGDGLRPVYSSRGAALNDLDADGRPDIVVLNSRQAATLIRNETTNRNGWLELLLVGRESNRSAVGASVKIHTSQGVLVDEVRSGRGYQSDFGPWLHFGLGAQDKVQKIEVRWPSENKSVIAEVAVDKRVVIVENAAAVVNIGAEN